MSEQNGYKENGQADSEQNNPFGSFNPMSFFNMFNGSMLNNTYPMLWNQYVNLLMRSQETVSKVMQGVWQFYGIATTEDVARMNRQLFEAYSRIDQLEGKIEDLEQAPSKK